MGYQPNLYKKLFHFTRRFAAKRWLKSMPATQIALTGSQGKTNTAALLLELLKTVGPTVATDVNLDTTFNVPLTALKVRPSTRFVIFELGVDHQHEMDEHLQIVKPEIAVITGISPVHTDQDHFGSLDNLINEKRKLITALPKTGYAVLNYDDQIVRAMAPFTRAQILWYGTDPKHCHLWTDQVQLTLKGTTFLFHNNLQSTYEVNYDPTNQSKITTQLIGKHHQYTVMASLLTIIALQKIKRTTVSLKSLVQKIEAVPPLPGRMSLEKGPLGTIILNDSLRANPASTKSGLQTLSAITGVKGRKFAVLAEMGELAESQREHENIGRLIAGLKIDYFVAIGPWQKFTAQTAAGQGMDRSKVFWVENVQEAADVLKPIVKRGDLIYLKGSLLRHVNRILMILEGQSVICHATLCPFYSPCAGCRYLTAGYKT